MFILSLVLSSCSLFKQNTADRELQTKIIKNINAKTGQFAKCAKKTKLFKTLGKERVRTVIYLSLNKSGNVETFKLDDQAYPQDFSECVYEVVELIIFPRNKKHDLIEIEQPFIFSKK